jgi:NADH-quinone oxidoreductase subunit E/NADP-reducing hydrogenase subunit HndA
MSVKIQISQKTRTKIEEICKSFNNKPGELINVLHKTQDFLGYLPA